MVSKKLTQTKIWNKKQYRRSSMNSPHKSTINKLAKLHRKRGNLARIFKDRSGHYHIYSIRGKK